ncbi:hypothetical protein AAGQ96_03130 [Pantoea sp. MBD-2R]|uniref:hypothetical protein n=1 Tax=Pantoea sp. MBD-2R TaxID=3141540 RepID=UPI0031843156
MTLENFTAYMLIFLFFLLIMLYAVANIWFKKKESDYEEFLSQFRGKDLQLDTATRMASLCGSYANYQKIIYFIRLYKGVRMHWVRGELVHKEAYCFVQNLPPEKIAWMLSLHSFYRVIFAITILFFIFMVIFIYCFY